MTNFKPSELPADTVIKDEERGVWMKEENGVWGQMVPHCIDCAETVNDDGTSDNTWMNGERVFIKADDFFKDFKIVSVPWQTAWELALKLQDEYGTVDCEGEDITVEGIIQTVMEEVADDQREEIPYSSTNPLKEDEL